jgi:hypothetical protein
MVVQNSTRPDISESIPVSLGRAGARAAQESRDKSFSIGIGGIGFNLRANGQHPYMREADQVRKEQFDASDQAGEQSLGTWWRRSQNDWSLGEGVEWYEPGVREETASRYWAGQGVNPWTQGRLTLHHDMDVDLEIDTVEPVYVSTYRYLGEDGYVVAYDDTISYQGSNLSGETRTNHLENPRFSGRGVDGTAIPNSQLGDEGSGGGRTVTFIGSTGGVKSYALGSHPAGEGGLGLRQPATDLPGVFSFASNFASLGSSSAAVLVKFEVAFYNDAGAGLGAGYFTEEARVGMGETRRFELHNLTVPELAYEFRIICFVRKESDFEFSTNMSFRHGVAIVEEGGIVGEPFNGAIPDTGTVTYSWVGTANDSKSTKVTAPVAEVTLPAGGVTQPVVAGGRVYHGRSGAVGFTTPGVAEAVTATCTGDARVWWVKSRLLVAVGPVLYWVDHTVSGQVVEVDGIEIADGGTDWTWVDVVDSPDSILMAGHDGTNSTVFSVTVTDDAGGLPEFTGAAEVARLPFGERITCMGTYLGAFVALGTTLGIRIGLVGDQGRVQYGPVLKRLDGVSDVSFYETFAYFAVTAGHPDGSSGLWRVDLSTEITNTGRQPYAADIYTPSAAAVTSVAFFGGSGRAVLVAGAVVWRESEAFVEEGWLTNGKVRFRTTANKDFQYLAVSGVLNGGTLDHRALVPGTTEEHRVITQTAATGLPRASLDISGGPLFEWMQIKTYVTPGVVDTPEINAVTLSAIPQPERSRLIRYPLQVADQESGRFGAKAGYNGFAFDRIQALESLEGSGQPLLVEDSRTGESYIGTIESAQFTGVDNSDKALTNVGGWLDVTVRVRT